ncbi:MAG: putative hydrogenase expression/formation protein HupK [Comamonadaceae bacterium]|nr:MAG: putative hydrogenase expression/formation protein HupK [Comamonadaceae bacterium]
MSQSLIMDLAGSYRLTPGGHPSIEGQRPILGQAYLGRLLRGLQGESVEGTLGHIFTLCGHAHRRTARLALNAAMPQRRGLPVAPPVLLWLETARDHLRSIALDWPRLQPGQHARPDQMDWLRGCPLPLSHGPLPGDPAQAWAMLAQLRQWVETRLLGQAVEPWLAQHHNPQALAEWSQAQATSLAPAGSLAAWYNLAHPLTPVFRPLALLQADPAQQATELQAIAQAMSQEASFAQHPTWQQQCFETGSWARLRHQHADSPYPVTAWTRLAARWIELLEIAALQPSASAQPLSSGALQMGSGQAIAWCEMARGLLLHWVQLDELGRVQDYRVLAPTEWNFHPNGALAQALSALPAHDTQSAWALAAAFDACVACQVSAPAPSEETHA